MPIYAYECAECGVRFERRQSFSDEPVRICPECGGTVHRLIQPAGIIFKGSGFYVTDNKKSKNPAGPGTSTAKSKSDASPDTSPSGSDSSSSTGSSTASDSKE